MKYREEIVASAFGDNPSDLSEGVANIASVARNLHCTWVMGEVTHLKNPQGEDLWSGIVSIRGYIAHEDYEQRLVEPDLIEKNTILYQLNKDGYAGLENIAQEHGTTPVELLKEYDIGKKELLEDLGISPLSDYKTIAERLKTDENTIKELYGEEKGATKVVSLR